MLLRNRHDRRRAARRAGLRQRRLCAFTLLELLVVIAVIALLVAVLLPSLASARRQAKQVVCQTNLRSIAGGWHAYLVDSHGRFLKSKKAKDNEQINYGGKQGAKSAYRGPKPLNRYLGLPVEVWSEAELFKCPFDRGSGFIRPTCYDYFGSSYLMNHMLVGPPKLQVQPDDPCAALMDEVGRRIAQVQVSDLANESRLLLAGDYGWYNAWETLLTPEYHVDWHHKTMHYNVAFMDGHVKFIRIRKGVHACGEYTVIPFKEQQTAACECQVEIACE